MSVGRADGEDDHHGHWQFSCLLVDLEDRQVTSYPTNNECVPNDWNYNTHPEGHQ